MFKVQSPKSEHYNVVQKLMLVCDLGRQTLDVGLRVSDLRKGFSSPSGQKLDVLRGVSLGKTG